AVVALFAGEADRLVATGDKRRRGPLQADMDTIEGDRPGPERVGKPKPHFTSPQIGPNDQAKALVARAGLGRWKGEAQIGLRRSVADRVGPRTEPVQLVTHFWGTAPRRRKR